MPKTLLVDFDGVLHAHMSEFTDPAVIADGPVSDAIEWLDEMVKAGFTVAIFSTRSSAPGGVDAMREWLAEHGADPDLFEFPTEKPIAFLSIDDRAWRFEGTFPTTAELEAFTPWNRRTFGLLPEPPDDEPAPPRLKTFRSTGG